MRFHSTAARVLKASVCLNYEVSTSVSTDQDERARSQAASPHRHLQCWIKSHSIRKEVQREAEILPTSTHLHT